MAALGLHWKQPYAVAMIMSPVLILLSGMTFPTTLLPSWLRPFSNAIPLTHGLRIVRDAILLGRGFGDLASAFAWLAVTGAAFMVVGFVAFRVMERSAREKGVMGRY